MDKSALASQTLKMAWQLNHLAIMDNINKKIPGWTLMMQQRTASMGVQYMKNSVRSVF